MSNTPHTAAELSDVAAEAIRGLNHATLPWGNGLNYPGDAYRTVANLAILAVRLPQALQQIDDFMNRLDKAGSLRSDNGPDDLSRGMKSLRASLNAGGRHAEALFASLNQAQAALGPIGATE